MPSPSPTRKREGNADPRPLPLAGGVGGEQSLLAHFAILVPTIC
jgi:hypothetical protein